MVDCYVALKKLTFLFSQCRAKLNIFFKQKVFVLKRINVRKE